MLSHAIRFIILIGLFLMTACSQKVNENQEKAIKVLEISKNVIGGKNLYGNLYRQCLDTLNTWCSTKLPGYGSICDDRTFRLDSALCLNKEKDRMVTAILVQCNEPICEADAVHYLYGAKIKGQWYFFRGGGTMVVIREHYQKDIHTPLSFEKLHELAMDEMLRGYIKKNRDGEWEVNDAFFSAHFEDNGWGNFEKQNTRDTLSNGKHFTDRKEYFESLYLRAAGIRK